MIYKCASVISNWLLGAGVIQAEDKELYEYAAYSVLITMSPMILAIIFGGIMGSLCQSIVLIVPFMIIRKFSGGYHAKNPMLCFVISCLLLVLCIIISNKAEYGVVTVSTLLISSISLILFSPIDSENRRLEQIEKHRYQLFTAILTILFSVLSVGLYYMKQPTYAVCISIGIILSAVLQIPCMITRIKIW